MSECRPKCTDCGTATGVHAVSKPDTLPGTSVSNVWLCGSCEYLREHPDATRTVGVMRANPKRPQEESLFT